MLTELMVLFLSFQGLSQTPCSPVALTQAAVVKPAAKIAEATEILHCLRTGDPNWLSDSPGLEKASWLQVGLVHDRKTFPGENLITVVVFENAMKGDVFEVVRKRVGKHRTYSVVNNGSIDPARKGLAWVGDVLFGIWTREYIARNARKVMRGPKYWIEVKTALRPIPRLTCTSYLDNQ